MCLDNQGLMSVFLYDVYYCYAFHLFESSTGVEICIVCKVCHVFIACFEEETTNAVNRSGLMAVPLCWKAYNVVLFVSNNTQQC